jgi:WhiB family redox-sensing transcriptional regulator
MTRPDPDWAQQAACASADPELFFWPDNERGPSRRRREDLAKRVCRPCPVRAECLAAAFREETRIPGAHRYGIRGGLTPAERR